MRVVLALVFCQVVLHAAGGVDPSTLDNQPTRSKPAMTCSFVSSTRSGLTNTPVAGASLANPFVTGLLPYPNSLVGNGIGAIFPDWITPKNQQWNANTDGNVHSSVVNSNCYVHCG